MYKIEENSNIKKLIEEIRAELDKTDIHNKKALELSQLLDKLIVNYMADNTRSK